MKLVGRLGLFLVCVSFSHAVTLEELAADPKRWPGEVLVTVTTKGTQLKNGQPGGVVLVGGGKKLIVTGVTADGVVGKLGGTTVRVAAGKTDLLQRLDPNYVPPAPAVESGTTAMAPAPKPKPAPAAAAAVATANGEAGAMHRRLSGKLVQLSPSGFLDVPDGALTNVKYFALYYSASWCGPCRAFTPKFIATYRQMKRKYPQFEVVFISNDRSADDMRNYVMNDEMPWTVLKYDLIPQNPELTRYRGDGIPCLVLVDSSGRVLSDSYENGVYTGPGHVLQDAMRIMNGG